jgi:hypothetical protein
VKFIVAFTFVSNFIVIAKSFNENITNLNQFKELALFVARNSLGFDSLKKSFSNSINIVPLIVFKVRFFRSNHP